MPCLPGVKPCALSGRVGRTLLLLLPLMAACSSGPPPRLYLLESINDSGLETQPLAVESLGLESVTLPGYADDARIASRAGGVQVVQDDAHRWAEPPEDALTRLLADRLRFFSGASVLVEPWPRGYDPELRLKVEFDRLLRTVAGGVEMAGRVQLLSGDGREVLRLIPFDVNRPALSNSPGAFFPATASAINQVTGQAIEGLREVGGL